MGASNASEYNQLAVPELVLPQLPLRSVRHPRLLLMQLLLSLGLCYGTHLARPSAALPVLRL